MYPCQYPLFTLMPLIIYKKEQDTKTGFEANSLRIRWNCLKKKKGCGKARVSQIHYVVNRDFYCIPTSIYVHYT